MLLLTDLCGLRIILYVIYIFTIYLSKGQKLKILCHFLIKHRHTKIYCPYSVSLSCMCRCVYYFFFIFHGIRSSMIFTPMILILLSAYIFLFLWNGIFTNSLQMLFIHPILHLHLLHLQIHWRLAPLSSSLAEGQSNCYVSSSVWFSFLLKCYTFFSALKL